MRLSGSGVYVRGPRMPAGLVELMQGLARDVLRHNPPDLDQFCAQHIEQLLVIRDGKAPSKERLTLEQKIKRAQEQIKAKADLRRRRYDEEMKEHNQDLISVGTSSPEEIKQVAASSIQKRNTICEDVKAVAEPIVEINLKAPVHHEQDISKSLEVEIFHKPIDNICNSVPTETSDEVEKNDNDTKEVDKSLTEEIKLEDSSQEEKYTKAEEYKNVSAAVLAKDLLEQIIINETNSQDSNDHRRVIKSLDLEANGERKSKGSEKAFVEIREVHKSATEDNGALDIQDKNDTSEKNHERETVDKVLTDNQTYLKNDDDLEIHNNTVLTNKVLETPPVVESDKEAFHKENSEDAENDTNVELNTTIESSISESITLDLVDKDPKEVIKAIQESFEKSDSVEEISTAVEPKRNGNIEICRNNESTENISNEDKNTVQNKEKTNEDTAIIEDVSLTKYIEFISDNTVDEKEIIKEGVSNENNNDRDRIRNGTSDFGKENSITENDMKIIEAIDQLEVCSEPVDINLVCGEKNSSVNDEITSEQNDSKNVAKVFNKESTAEEQVTNSENVTKESNDAAITSVHEILSEETSVVRDDNDSAPKQMIQDNNIKNNGKVNGTHENTNNDIMENGSESPDLDDGRQMDEKSSNQDISNEAEVVETQDDKTTISEPIKTDIETSSQGKSSSIDDSFAEEGVIETITEIDEIASTKLAQNRGYSSNMDLETAAVTIQKVFRTFLFKSRESTFDDTGRDNSIDVDSEKLIVDFPEVAAPLNMERRALGISRMDTVLQTVNEEKSLSLSTDDSSLSSAATIIQAHVRGFLTRNRLNSIKTNSSSVVNSDGPSSTSFENDPEQKANKTVLNIHIVPEGEHFLSRDESLLTSMELSLDGSPPSSTNLHPLGYDKSEPRKQLKREDAIQSISPPSNNSGKLSEDVDPVKDITVSELQKDTDESKDETYQDINHDFDDTPSNSATVETVIEARKFKEILSSLEQEKDDVETVLRRKESLLKVSSDEGDVVTPFEEKSSTDSDATSRLLHSGEFHDVVLPTKVLRGDTSVVRGE